MLVIAASLWISHNALVQTRLVLPGEDITQAMRALFLGRPLLAKRYCPPEVHDMYVTPGPDGRPYPTWHPPLDMQHGCYFTHEHGSDPQAYAGFASSGMPAFGYTSRMAGRQETHPGYKVFVANDDLNGRAWMITLHQDTGDPRRVLQQYHTLDWHISSLDGEELVDLHVLADFGYARANCRSKKAIPGSASGYEFNHHQAQQRSVLTTDCAGHNTFEKWGARVRVGEVFEAGPLFEVDNPITAVDLQDLERIHSPCEFRPVDEGCTSSSGSYWRGTRRTVFHPGQRVDNHGPAEFFSDAYGNSLRPGQPGAIRQYVTPIAWDTRQCCGPEVVFRLQTFSQGLYVAPPVEPPGSAEFDFWPP